MTETLRRYPGAQPFRDDELSRRSFFGRDSAAAALTDQILANRLVIVYGRSGLGKSSLLNAGVAPRLREAGCLPLFVRVNNIQRGAVASIYDGIRAEAERQQIEYVPGDDRSLWSFFKTAEFWRDDLLLTPVLIVDQFEELFTLQSFEERDRFLSELSYLLRGVPPPSVSLDSTDASPSPPVIHVVLSLREDFLGLLEEASDQVPEILDHRYRVAPLSPEMAAEAITGPAALEYAGMATRAFRLEPACVQAILRYLTHSSGELAGRRGLYVEPFHLQLICQQLESVADFKQKLAPGEVALSFADIGGERALAETLKSFYSRSIAALPRRYRRAARRMCERHLISSEGRRLSIEERQLTRELKLPPEVLRLLTDGRLLRTDRRSESTYYELGHDALVAPILASRQTQSFLLYGAAIFSGSLAVLSALFLALFTCIGYYTDKERNSSTYAAVALCLGLAVFLGFLGRAWLRVGIRRRSRYGYRSTSSLAAAPPPPAALWRRLLGWTMLLAAPGLLLFWGLYGLVGLIQYSYVAVRHGKVAESFVWMVGGVHEAWMLMHEHPFLEMLWWIVVYGTTALLGYWLFWRGDRLLWPESFSFRYRASAGAGIAEHASLPAALLRTATGIVALAVAILGFSTMSLCSSSLHGTMPYWLSWPMMSYRFSSACELIYEHDWNFDAFNFLLFFVSVSILALVLLIGGIVETRAALRFRRLTRNESPSRQALILAAAGTALAIFFALVGFSWRAPAGFEPAVYAGGKIRGAIERLHPSARHAGWVAGGYATILRTEDDGRSWKSQIDGKGWLHAIRAVTPSRGCVVGDGGALWTTDNGGASWVTRNSGTKLDLYAAAFVTPSLGWVAGGNNEGGIILRTDDGGATWKAQTAEKMITSLAFVSPASGWAVGNAGLILHTDDGGISWKRQDSHVDNQLNDISFPTPTSGWAVGSEGVILHTDDAGRTWKTQSSGTVLTLNGISFPTPTSGWAVGELGTILHTDDGGRTWVHQQSGTRVDLSEASFLDSKFGWAVGNAGIVLHTEDGHRWIIENSGIRKDLRSVAILKPFGMLGISIKKDSEKSHGAIVGSVAKGGPADQASLSPNDVVESIDGVPVASGADLVNRIYLTKPGSTVTLTYLRNGRISTTTVVLADGSKPPP